HQRIAAQYLAGAGRGEGVLVVDAGVADPDHDVTRGEVVEGQLLEAGEDTSALGVDAECLEAVHGGTALSLRRLSQAMRPWVLRERSPASACSISSALCRQP